MNEEKINLIQKELKESSVVILYTDNIVSFYGNNSHLAFGLLKLLTQYQKLIDNMEGDNDYEEK